MIGIIAAAAAAAVSVGGIDCSGGFDRLMEAVTTTPGIVRDPSPRGFLVFVDAKALTIYTVTTPEQAAHPALIRRQAVVSGSSTALQMSGCSFGDKAAFDTLINRFDELNSQAAREAGGR